MARFMMQIVLPLPDVKAFVTIIETNAPPKKPDTVSIYFDLDLYRTESIPQDEGGLWSMLEEFRVKKKIIFEACITEKLRELIR